MADRIYHKTQIGVVIVLCMLPAILITAVVAVAREPMISAIVVLLGAAACLFSSLTIKVDPDGVHWFFGPGFLKKTIALAQIEAAACVRNKWWYGWGIRRTPHGWLYNVSGLSAVELKLTNGRAVRLGTAEPEKLREAILQAQSSQSSA